MFCVVRNLFVKFEVALLVLAAVRIFQFNSHKFLAIFVLEFVGFCVRIVRVKERSFVPQVVVVSCWNFFWKLPKLLCYYSLNLCYFLPNLDFKTYFGKFLSFLNKILEVLGSPKPDLEVLETLIQELGFLET